MSRFDWSSVYPNRRIITLIVDDAEAAELLEAARDEGRVMALNVIRGLPAIAFGPVIEPEHDNDDDRSQGGCAAAPSRASSMRSSCAEPAAPRALADARTARRDGHPDPKVAILPVVFREPMGEAKPVSTPVSDAVEPRFSGRSPLAETPPKQDHARPRGDGGPPETVFHPVKGKLKVRPVTEADRAMVAEAIATGTVTITKCPPRTYALDETAEFARAAKERIARKQANRKARLKGANMGTGDQT